MRNEDLASGSRDETAKVWDMATWQQHAAVTEHRGFVHDVRFHPMDSSWLAVATGDRHVGRWSITDDGQSRPRGEPLRGFDDTVSEIDFSADGSLLAAAGFDGTIRVWRADTGALQTILREQHAEITALAFVGPDELLTATRAGGVSSWSLRDQADSLVIDAHLRCITGLAYLADDDTLASTSYAGDLRLWTAEGELADLWQRAEDAVSGLAVTADHRHIVWESGGNLYQLRPGGGDAWDVVALPTGPLFLNAFAIAPGGKWLWAADFAGVKMLEVATGRVAWTWSEGEITCLAASPTQATIVAAGEQRRLWIADAHDGRFRPFPSLGSVRSLAVSADGKLVGVGTATGEAAIHDLASGETMARATVHSGPVHCLVFSPDGKTVATGGSDGAVQLWDPVTGSERIRLTTPRVVRALAFAPDGNALAAGDEDGTIRVWRTKSSSRP